MSRLLILIQINLNNLTNLNDNKQQNDQEFDENQQPIDANSHPNQINLLKDSELKPIQLEQHVDTLPNQEIIPKEKVEPNSIKTNQNTNSIDLLQKQASVMKVHYQMNKKQKTNHKLSHQKMIHKSNKKRPKKYLRQ